MTSTATKRSGPRSLTLCGSSPMPDPYFAAEFAARVSRALTVPCRYCDAPAGVACRNKVTGGDLAHMPAHTSRELDAEAMQ
jgi:hypothetical protein